MLRVSPVSSAPALNPPEGAEFMPDYGAQSSHRCVQCGQPMVWSAAVMVPPDPLGASPGMAARPERADAYLCPEAHSNPKCTKCGSYDTDAWAKPEAPPAAVTVHCNACGAEVVVTQKAVL
jgi:hypothetical protein